MNSKVYPFRRSEKLLASLLPVLLLAGFLPSPPVTPQPDGTWRLCIGVGFIVQWERCWDIGKPKLLPPDPVEPQPCPLPCDPSIQSCPAS